ncbi:MAG: DegT/DnrJ/EryC1/StrS family aminotransferase, partial [Promethearchaeota archaeon]
CGGEGGLITTNDEELYNKINMFVNHGQKAKYIHSSFGLNFRMPAVSGICARYSLKQLDKNNEKRISNAQYYNEHLSDIKGLVLPHTPEGYKHVFHQYTIQTDMRDALSEQFSKSEIGYGIHYKIPIHKQEFYINQGYSDHLPNTEAIASKVISLPIHPELTTEQLDYVVQNIKKILK